MKSKRWMFGIAAALLFGTAGMLAAQSEETQEAQDAEVPAGDVVTRQFAVVYFGPDEVQVFLENLAELDAAGSYLGAFPEAKLIIRGYAAKAGYEGGRMDVSRRRAEYCRRYLQTRFSLAAERFQTEWFGSEREPEGGAGTAASMRCAELLIEEKVVPPAPVDTGLSEEESYSDAESGM
ncbi:MAG: OmpA family protein [Spirochaetaceae bacterium]|jgi:hypothetical protein|nr:OmpA family protein [Spirochaetaceae bacterium]